MTLLIAAIRGALEAVIVVDAALAVFWAWVSPGGLRTAAALAVMAAVAAVAGLGLAALPGPPGRRRRRRL